MCSCIHYTKISINHNRIELALTKKHFPWIHRFWSDRKIFRFDYFSVTSVQLLVLAIHFRMLHLFFVLYSLVAQQPTHEQKDSFSEDRLSEKQTNNQMQQEPHVVLQTESKKIRFKCLKCGADFSNTSNLKRHEKMQHGLEQPMLCIDKKKRAIRHTKGITWAKSASPCQKIASPWTNILWVWHLQRHGKDSSPEWRPRNWMPPPSKNYLCTTLHSSTTIKLCIFGANLRQRTNFKVKSPGM